MSVSTVWYVAKTTTNTANSIKKSIEECPFLNNITEKGKISRRISPKEVVIEGGKLTTA